MFQEAGLSQREKTGTKNVRKLEPENASACDETREA